ncbi:MULTISPECIES: DUF4342 domain-containing protein [unclassified Actinomyces]|uniref:DUF4342 domain-containing protein n=1 Tax=unclassified Actinomyces TaxID=2609248 RepID=UPI000D597961|nr:MULTISPECIES: DUF4342 domain-containing protein [unclassified Actinomyces]RAX21884.1 DUF4342 domain-containing protein [Actinomyces sp. Z3]
MSTDFHGFSSGPDSAGGAPRTVVDWITVAGDQLIATIKQLVADGNVRRVILRDSSGREFLSVPLTASAVVGGITVLAAPVLAAIGVIAAMVAEVTLEVERTDVEGGSEDVTAPSPNPDPEV